MSDEDPTGTSTYECDKCGYRMTADHQPETCPECGGGMFDIEVSRE